LSTGAEDSLGGHVIRGFPSDLRLSALLLPESRRAGRDGCLGPDHNRLVQPESTVSRSNRLGINHRFVLPKIAQIAVD